MGVSGNKHAVKRICENPHVMATKKYRTGWAVRCVQGRILLHSHSADPEVFPTYDGPCVPRTATHRLYDNDALHGSIGITVTGPQVTVQLSGSIQISLGLLLLVIFALLLAIILTARARFASVRHIWERLRARKPCLMLLQDPNNLLFTETAHLHCLSPQVENRLPQMPDSSGQQVDFLTFYKVLT